MRHMWREWFQKLSEKRLKITDVVWVAVVAISFSLVGQMAYLYDFSLNSKMDVQVPWLVKTDIKGDYYVVDDEKTRVLKVVEGKLASVIQGCAPSGDTFYYAENIAVADNGDIFVLDTGWSPTGFSVNNETILRYDSTGEILGVCYEADYSDIYCDKHRIFGMEVREDKLYFVTADEKGFCLRQLDIDTQKCEIVQSYIMEDAITLIQDFVIDTENLGIYAIDKRGKLLYAEPDASEARLLYQLPGNMPELEKTAFYRGCMGEKDTVYVTDIASGRLLRFSGDNDYQMEPVLTGAKMWNVSYSSREDGAGMLTYISDGEICAADVEGFGAGAAQTGGAENVAQYASFDKSEGYIARELLFDLLALIGLIGAIYLLARSAALLFSFSYSNTQKISMLVICTVIAVSIILVYGLMGQFKDTYRGELLTKLTMISQIVSNSMEESEIEDIAAPQNFMNESYQSLWNKISTMIDKNYDYSEDLYCNILRYDGNDGYAVVYLDNSIGTYYPLTEDETKEVRNVYESGTIFQSDVQSETGSYIYVHTPIFGSDGQVIGVVSVGTLSDVIDGKISSMTQNIIIAMIMIVLTIMFLFSEVLSFFDLREKYRSALRLRHQEGAVLQTGAAGPGNEIGNTSRGPIPMHVVRVLVFITFMAFNMATSFMPVYIMRFVSSDMGMPTALANSLPMTLNLIAIGVTSIFCPRLIKKIGFSKMAVISGLMALTGDLSMAVSTHYAMIVGGLVLNGIGVGFITNSIHIFIASLSTDGEEGDGFSLFNAASLSGINCGMLFGSALAERIGQSSVFLVSAGAWGLVGLVFILVGKRLVMSQAGSERPAEKYGMIRFIASPAILKFMLCVQVPYIVMNSFTYYYVPIYGSENGLTENITSLLIIVCSLCSVYLSVAATNFLLRRFQDRAMYLSSIITFAGLLIFAWRMTLPSLVLALVLIGIANSFGASTRISYFIRMKEAVRFGEDNAMGSYDLVDNIGESTGSIIFASIISVGFRTGILGLIGCVAGLNAVYALTGRKGREADNETEKS